MENNKKHTIIVSAIPENGKVNIEIGFINQEPKLGYDETCHILASAISLLIRGTTKIDGTKDYKLMRDIIEHLNSEFVNLGSFDDFYVNPNLFDNP